MRFGKWGLLACAVMSATPCISLAAQQVALGKVNTSVGVKPTSTRNKFALETDPVLQGSIPTGGTPADYIPVEGLLNNHFDTSQFSLVTDPNTGTYALGSTVAGEGAYQVVGFEVQTVDGGLINVQDNGLGGETVADDTTNPLDPTHGPVGGGETGNVYDIHFKIISQDRSLAQSSDQDQNFYELFLNQIGNNPPGLDSTFVTDDSYINFAPIDPNSELTPYSVTAPNIVDSFTPEVSSAGFLAFGGLTLFLRRRKTKTQPLAVASNSTPPANA